MILIFFTMKKLDRLILLFFSFICLNIHAQIDDSKKLQSLREKISDNSDLLMTDTEKAFHNIDELLKEAVSAGDKEAELILLSNLCWYYSPRDMNKAIETSHTLETKAKAYNNLYYQAAAHEYLSKAYSYSDLPDKALEEFRKQINILNRIDDERLNQDVIFARVNAYTIASLAYIQKNDKPNYIKMLLKANEEATQLNDSDRKRKLLCINYSNLGGIYDHKPDSAEYFVLKSMALMKPEEEVSNIQFTNYQVLGSINKKKKNYPLAIQYYKKAEAQIPLVNLPYDNIKLIYEGLSDIYKETDSIDLANSYLQKLDKLALQQEKTKNKSLHTIIEKKMLEDKTTVIYVTVGLSFVIVILLGIIIYFRKKNQLLHRQEEVSQQYLEKTNQNPEPGSKNYTRLIEMAKNDDPAFMAAFYEAFPNFAEKLRNLNPKIVQTELEFCAYLKLNLPTNEIAIYKNIEKRTVQVKKYRIRKKLNIPDDIDIYMWFNQL